AGGAVAQVVEAAARSGDTVVALEARIAELERMLADAERGREDERDLEELRQEIRRELVREMSRNRRARGAGVLDRVGDALGKLFSLLLTYGVLVGLGFAAVFFGRRYLEGV